MTRRALAGCFAGAFGLAAVPTHSSCAVRRTCVSVQVLQLLKPSEVKISPAGNAAIEFGHGHRSELIWPGQSKSVDVNDGSFFVRASGQTDAHFRVTLRDGFSRDYFGRLSGMPDENGVLLLAVDMTVETAVGSIISAELPTSGVALPALKAQGVVARSFLTASGRRHAEADFCDTTHCQFLRSPAVAGSMAQRAQAQTRDLVLTANGEPFPALYSAACGGETEQREEGGYLYRRVRCESCEQGHRARSGHGLGLCQNAALELAKQGWPWQRILTKYYPGAEVRIQSGTPRG